MTISFVWFNFINVFCWIFYFNKIIFVWFLLYLSIDLYRLCYLDSGVAKIIMKNLINIAIMQTERFFYPFHNISIWLIITRWCMLMERFSWSLELQWFFRVLYHHRRHHNHNKCPSNDPRNFVITVIGWELIKPHWKRGKRLYKINFASYIHSQICP